MEHLFRQGVKSSHFGVSACFIEQHISTVPSFVETNAATVINFTAEDTGGQKQAEVLGRYQTIVKVQNKSKIIKTMPFAANKIIKGLEFKPQAMTLMYY